MSDSIRQPDRLTFWASRLVWVSVCQFVFIVAASMLVYPGGNHFDPHTIGYDFWRNTLCDLGNSHANQTPLQQTMAGAFNGSLGGFAVGLLCVWIILPRLIPTYPRTGQWVRRLGILSFVSMIGIPLTPTDEYLFLHALAIGLAAVPGITAFLLAFGYILKNRDLPLWYRGFLPWFMLASLYHFWQYANHFWLNGLWTPAAPIFQKITTIMGLFWMTTTAQLAIRTIRPTPTDHTTKP